jgi:hypothetical protein
MSSHSSRLRWVCGTRRRRSARTTAVSVETASVAVLVAVPVIRLLPPSR